jgi:hypothetical protein
VFSVEEGPDGSALLAVSAERDLWLSRLLDAERAAYWRGYQAGDLHGYCAGRADERAESQAAFHAVAARVCETPEQAEASAARRIRAAESYTRRHALWWWQTFFGAAFRERPERRTEQQHAAVALARKRSAA